MPRSARQVRGPISPRFDVSFKRRLISVLIAQAECLTSAPLGNSRGRGTKGPTKPQSETVYPPDGVWIGAGAMSHDLFVAALHINGA